MITEENPSRKGLFEKLYIPILVVLVGVGFFGLGRYSALDHAKKPVVLHGVVYHGVEQEVKPAPAPAP